MFINETLNYILARRADILLPFSAAVTTASTYLKGAGGEAGDGLPLARGGKAVGIEVWDGANRKSATAEISLTAGDRVSLYANYGTTDFTVKLRVNGLDTTLAASGVAANTTLYAALHIIQE